MFREGRKKCLEREGRSVKKGDGGKGGRKVEVFREGRK